MSERWEFGETDATDTPTPDDGDPSTRFPWPPAEGESILGAIATTWKGSALEPGAFFSRVPGDRGTSAAVLYYLGIGVMVAGAALFWNSLSLLGDPSAQDPLAAELGIAAVNPVVGFLLSPAFLLAGLIIGAGISHVLLLIFGGARSGFGTTIRVYCYSSSPSIFGVVPILGTLVGWVWGIVILIIGLGEAHEAPTWKPALAVLLPMVLFMGLFLLVIVAAVLALGSGIAG